MTLVKPTTFNDHPSSKCPLFRNLRRLFLTATCSVVLFAGAQSSQAGTLSYTQVSTLSGTIGGTAFTNATVTFQTSADTANTISGGGAYLLAGTTTVDIDGIGTATLNGSDSFGVFALSFNGLKVAGFADITTQVAIAYIGIPTAYDLSTAASFTGTNAFVGNRNNATSLGILHITGASGSGSFTATEVADAPEPSSMALLAGALAAAVGFRRKR